MYVNMVNVNFFLFYGFTPIVQLPFALLNLLVVKGSFASSCFNHMFVPYWLICFLFHHYFTVVYFFEIVVIVSILYAALQYGFKELVKVVGLILNFKFYCH